MKTILIIAVAIALSVFTFEFFYAVQPFFQHADVTHIDAANSVLSEALK